MKSFTQFSESWLNREPWYELNIFANESAGYVTQGPFTTLDAAKAAARKDAAERKFTIQPLEQHFLDYMSKDYKKTYVAGFAARFYQVLIAQLD